VQASLELTAASAVSNDSAMNSIAKALVFAVSLPTLSTLSAAESQALVSQPRVQITQLDDRLRVEIDGQLFTEYYFKNVPRPYCYPLMGPGELPMTRDWPMKNPPGEEHDHPHHRSLWFAHGLINGVDFWSEEKNFGKTIHEGFPFLVTSGPKSASISSSNSWITADGKLVCTDNRTLRFYAPANPHERMFDF